MQRTGHEFYRKTRNNSIVKLVRERMYHVLPIRNQITWSFLETNTHVGYIRDDIPCQSEVCKSTPSCQELTPTSSALLTEDATHYVVPDISASAFMIRDLQACRKAVLTIKNNWCIGGNSVP